MEARRQNHHAARDLGFGPLAAYGEKVSLEKLEMQELGKGLGCTG